VGPGARLDSVAKKIIPSLFLLGLNPDCSTCTLVSILDELPRLALYHPFIFHRCLLTIITKIYIKWAEQVNPSNMSHYSNDSVVLH